MSKTTWKILSIFGLILSIVGGAFIVESLYGGEE